jgi:hypothetical protein
MDNILLIAEIVSAVSVLAGIVSAFFVWIKRLVEGQKCQLRSEMLSTYHKHKDNCVLRQYELENFILMYKAYKALKGNSFIDIIYNEVKEWKVES